MVLIDTSIWVDFLQKPDAPGNARLEALIRGVNRAAVCGLVLQEVLQGIRDDASYREARDRLTRLPFLDADREAWLLAAGTYRRLRAAGVSVPPVDVSIAALAIRHDVPLFTRDRHFVSIAAHAPLRLLSIAR